ELLGNNISMATKSLYVRDGKLFVTLYSSVIRNELSMIKNDIIEKLNESAGKKVIEDIILR
ncbi:MAG TPA: DciA family protein, partial [Bacteroidales bacterium]|nr:DciA family protein [Bacteroidales bacterium]